jgi:hypothetical protein
MTGDVTPARTLDWNAGEASLQGPFSRSLQQQLGRSKAEPHRIGFLYRPGRSLSDGDLSGLVAELRRVAMSCFDDVPTYQCLTGARDELAHNVIAYARRADGTMAGFCSAVVLQVPGVGEVLHLGLTCVHPSERGGGLTHKLTSALVVRYLLRHPLRRQWVTNLACVLSSLGNVALHFDQVYPSPFHPRPPTATHRRIAAEVDRSYRDKMFVVPGARFDSDRFVFTQCATGTVFQKRAEDGRFHHRDGSLNAFYRQHMDIDAGDEALQVGSVSLPGYPLYLLRRAWRARLTSP